MIQSQRKTKIIATLGPSTESSERLREMILAGVNIFRLNMSHANHDWVRQIVVRIRCIAEELKMIVGIMMDTQGPAVRTGDLPMKINLKVGEIMEFTMHGGTPSPEIHSVSVNYDGLINDISEGDVILVDNGMIHLRVLSKHGNTRIRCEVLTSGELGSRRHINLPGVKVNLPSLTEKDFSDISIAAEIGVDFIALSFCRDPADIVALREVLARHQCHAKIIAKIEDQSAVKVVDDILKETDAIMIARGDLGIECPMEELPIIQRHILKTALKIGRPVIVATHMLESMIENVMPTRAEVTDVANAVFEQADAIMLSGETTTGKYPVECVQVLDRIARRIERSGGARFAEQALMNNARQKIAQAGVVLSNSLAKSDIVVLTCTGSMANYTSHMRPRHSTIYALTPSKIVAGQMTLLWGVFPIITPFNSMPEELVQKIEKILMQDHLITECEYLIIMSDIMGVNGKYNSIQLLETDSMNKS